MTEPDSSTGMAEPMSSTSTIMDADTTLIWQVMNHGAGISIGSRNLLLFRNLPALVRFATAAMELANAWHSVLPDESPLRAYSRQANATGVTPAVEPVTGEQLDSLERLLKDIDLSGLEGKGAS